MYLIRLGLLMALATACGARADGPGDAPGFAEVYGLIRTNLAGANDAELNRVAVSGLISGLSPRVSLVTNRPSAETRPPLLTRTNVIDGEVGCLCVGRVGEGLAEAVRQAYSSLQASNKLKGLVLDLRGTDGTDYAAAAATVDLFLAKEMPLMDWGADMARSKEKQDAITLPLGVLVDRQTAAAAEALAAALRQTGAGLIFGGTTAGQAMIAREFALSNGEQLRIAAGKITLGDGAALTGKGIKPDIVVETTVPERRTGDTEGLAQATAMQAGASGGTTNRMRRLRFNEAELVRERKEGLSADDLRGGRREPGSVPAPNLDPVLARAVDVLKGVDLVRRLRS